MAEPRRIQRSRAKGWRMPEGAVYVGRPTKWGNQFKVGQHDRNGGVMDADDVVERFLARVIRGVGPISENDIKRELRGRDLVCWCRLDQTCHADVLLEIANAPTCEEITHG